MQYFYRFGWYFGTTSYLPDDLASRWEPAVDGNTKSQKTPVKARARDSKPLIQLHKTAENSRGRPGSCHVGPSPPRPCHSLPAAPALGNSAVACAVPGRSGRGNDESWKTSPEPRASCSKLFVRLHKTAENARRRAGRSPAAHSPGPPSSRPTPPPILFCLQRFLSTVRCTGPRRHAK